MAKCMYILIHEVPYTRQERKPDRGDGINASLGGDETSESVADQKCFVQKRSRNRFITMKLTADVLKQQDRLATEPFVSKKHHIPMAEWIIFSSADDPYAAALGHADCC